MSKLDQAIKDLASFIRDTHLEISATPDQPKRGVLPEVMISAKEYGTLMLDGEDAAKYRQILTDIGSSVGENVSKKFAEGRTRECVLQSLDMLGTKGGQFDQRLAASCEALRSQLTPPPRHWRVYLRVCGLAAKDLPRNLGRVTFCLFDENRVSSLNQSLDAIIDLSAHADGEKQVIKQQLKDTVDESLSGKVMAAVDVAAVDPDAATELSTAELRRTIDVVNFYSDILVSGGMRCRVYLPGEAASYNEVVPALTQDDGPALFQLNHSAVGPLVDFQGGLLASPKASEVGIPRASALLVKANRNRVEDALLAALQLGGRATAMVHDRREEAFLLYMICIESLVAPRGTGETTYRLSRRLAHLLGSSLERRRRVAHIVGELYSKRSAIAHRGRAEITDSDLELVRFVAKSTIVRLLLDEPFVSMKNRSELEAWFDDQLLG